MFQGEGVAGALFWKDLVTLAQEVGFCAPVVYSAEVMTIQNENIRKRIPGL